jgi:hypothetical protein
MEHLWGALRVSDIFHRVGSRVGMSWLYQVFDRLCNFMTDWTAALLWLLVIAVDMTFLGMFAFASRRVKLMEAGARHSAAAPENRGIAQSAADEVRQLRG